MKPEHPQFLRHFARVNIEREADRMAANLDQPPRNDFLANVFLLLIIGLAFAAVAFGIALIDKGLKQAAFDAVHYGESK